MRYPRRPDMKTPSLEIKQDFIRKLPKTDLHCHLDGSLRMGTVLELMKGNQGKRGYYSPAEIKRRLVPGKRCASLGDYLKVFGITLSVMQSRESLIRIAYELAQDCAEENVRYVEVRYSPMLHTNQGLKLPDVVESVIAGLKKAERDFGIRTGIIICGIRNITPRWSYRLAQLAVEFKNQGVVGFDLAGEEKDFPAKDHRKAFALIINHFINSTVHAGEAFGAKSIAQAIRYCGAHRIGHGVRLREDPELLNFVTDHRIPLEICLSSNVQTGVVRVMKEHPFKFYYEYGVRVTLNTDNRLMSDTSMSKELYLACKNFNLSLLNLRDILINGFKSAFLPYNEKVRLLKASLAQIDYLIESEHPEMMEILKVHI
ncbi:MAG: adenosine deaminase [Candidatus Aureabacteria bacterium]|nr:adenosine deaminase [Candidatus Auribacterota bacterium]